MFHPKDKRKRGQWGRDYDHTVCFVISSFTAANFTEKKTPSSKALQNTQLVISPLRRKIV